MDYDDDRKISLDDITVFSAIKDIPKYKLDLLPISQDNIVYREEFKETRGLELAELTYLGIEDLSVLICYDAQEHYFVSHCERRGFRYGLILIGQECLTNYMGYISSPNCIFVVRSYFNPIAYRMAKKCNVNSKMLHIRNKVSDEFYKLSKNKNLSKKDTAWFFAGQLKNGRSECLNSFLKLSGGKYVITDQGFLDDKKKTNALKTPEYFEYMSRACFIPCPLGWVNIDTQRVYEALDAGSIPVMIKNLSNSPSSPNYWEYIFSKNECPCIIESTWDAAVDKCIQIIKDNQYESLNKKYFNFWKERQSRWKSEILFFFESLLAQKNKRSNSIMYPIALTNSEKI